MASEDDQLELDLEKEEDVLTFESLTLTADTCLMNAMGNFKHVFVLGVDDNGFCYRSDHHDAAFWLYALERARDFIKSRSA